MIVNKVHYDGELPDDGDDARAPSWPTALGDADLAERVAANFADYRALAERDRRNVEHLAAEMRTRAVIQVPYLDHDVHDLAGLMEINRYLFASGSEERERDRRLGLSDSDRPKPPGVTPGGFACSSWVIGGSL